MDSKKSELLQKYSKLFDRQKYQRLHEEISFGEYVEKCMTNPGLLRNAYQYIYDMIVSDGKETFKRFRKTYTRYNFFTKHKTKVFGLEEQLESIVNFIKSAAGGYGTHKRLLLLHGPVGSSKSTTCRAIKQGLERYSYTEEGSWYTYKWVDLPNKIHISSEVNSPLHENPYKLLPSEIREAFFKDANEQFAKSKESSGSRQEYDLTYEGELNPLCKLIMRELMAEYNGDWETVLSKHVKVYRHFHSESDRVGIGTFQPKDEKNQDSTELNGDINYRNIGHYGSDSDPRAFNFDGEFEVGNRGMVEFIEVLKLETEFLYDLLEATQDHSIKPKKFSRVTIDSMLIGHTNPPEYEKLKGNSFMEAFRDRTVKVDVPYLLRWSDEIKVLEADYGNNVKQHVMPHTIEIAAFFDILTRLADDPDSKLDLRDKVKLYNGQGLPNWTEDSVKELQDKHPDEGLKSGVSARYTQDCFAVAIAQNPEYVNAFHLLNIIRDRLTKSSLISQDKAGYYDKCVDLAAKELEDILKQEVQKAMVSDETVMVRLCAKYIDNLIAYVNNEKIRNQITGKDTAPDERLMRSIEEKIGIPEQGSRDFRRSIAGFMGTLATRNQKFEWDSNPQLARAIQAKVFDDIRDTIKLSTLSSDSSVVDPDLQEKIDAIKSRLVKNFGYNHQSATDILEHVSNIFASGSGDND